MMAPVFIHGVDAGDEDEWRAFLAAHPFGELVAGGGPDGTVPVVVPTQYVLDGDDVLVHLLARNPVWAALAENPAVVLAVSGDWAFVPSSWKAVGDEDPRLGIPTTYYASVQLTGAVTVARRRRTGVAAVLRTQLAALQPDEDVVDPSRARGAAARDPGAAAARRRRARQVQVRRERRPGPSCRGPGPTARARRPGRPRRGAPTCAAGSTADRSRSVASLSTARVRASSSGLVGISSAEKSVVPADAKRSSPARTVASSPTSDTSAGPGRTLLVHHPAVRRQVVVAVEHGGDQALDRVRVVGDAHRARSPRSAVRAGPAGGRGLERGPDLRLDRARSAQPEDRAVGARAGELEHARTHRREHHARRGHVGRARRPPRRGPSRWIR